MTGRKTKPQGPRVSRSDPATRPARQASKSGDVEEKRVAASAGKKARTEQTPRKSAVRAPASVPLLAHTSKKVGVLDTAPRARKPQARASYQPKTQPPATPVHAPAAVPRPAIDLMAMAQPWMTLGWRMTAAGLALQARMAKAALDMPPAAAAMRQSAEALNAWFTLMQTRPTKTRKD